MRKRTTITAGLIALALAGLALAQKFGSYPENSSPAGGDLLLSVDLSDTTDDPTGSTKWIDLDGVKSYALDGFDSSDLLDIAQHTGTLADLDSAIGLTGTADSSTYLRGDGAWVAVPTGGLGTNLTSSTDDLLSDNGTMKFGGTGGTNNEGFDLDFETTANTIDVLQINGADTWDFTDWTLLMGALDVTTLTADSLEFEGATEDAFETTLDVVDPTADRTFTLPDASGTAATVGIYTEAHAASHTLSVDAGTKEGYGSVHYVTAASVTLTLPAVATGASYTIICNTANTVIVDANGADLIILDGTSLDDGDSIDSPGAAGDLVTLTYYDGTGWFAVSNSWTDGGAS